MANLIIVSYEKIVQKALYLKLKVYGNPLTRRWFCIKSPWHGNQITPPVLALGASSLKLHRKIIGSIRISLAE